MERSKIDSIINFTWSDLKLVEFGKEYSSIQWEDCIIPPLSDSYVFRIETDGNVRFWIDGLILINEWDHSLEGGIVSGTYYVYSSHIYEISLEYREPVTEASAFVCLMWSSKKIPEQVIPSLFISTRKGCRVVPLNGKR